MSVRSICDKGFRTYLAEQHKSDMDSSLTVGLSVATVSTGVLLFLNEKLKLNLAFWQILTVFPIITSFSLFPSLFSRNSEDLEHKEAFDAVCKKYSEEESGE